MEGECCILRYLIVAVIVIIAVMDLLAVTALA